MVVLILISLSDEALGTHAGRGGHLAAPDLLVVVWVAFLAVASLCVSLPAFAELCSHLPVPPRTLPVLVHR